MTIQKKIQISLFTLFYSNFGFSQELPPYQIGFTSARDGNYEIYSIDANGDNPKNLSNHPKTDYAFSCSSDGKKSCFTLIETSMMKFMS